MQGVSKLIAFAALGFLYDAIQGVIQGIPKKWNPNKG